LKSKSVPEQIVFRVNMKFFKSLPEEWHGSHLQSYTSALASLEGALKGKFADLAKNAKDSQTGLIYAYALLNAVYESNPSGEIKERGQAFQKVLDTYAAGPKDSVAAKVQEADKLLKAKKDKLVKGILNAYTEHPLVGSSYTPDEFKYINTTVEKYAQGYVDVWGTEVKLTLEGAEPTEVKKLVKQKVDEALEVDKQELLGIASLDSDFVETIKVAYPSRYLNLYNQLTGAKV